MRPRDLAPRALGVASALGASGAVVVLATALLVAAAAACGERGAGAGAAQDAQAPVDSGGGSPEDARAPADAAAPPVVGGGGLVRVEVTGLAGAGLSLRLDAAEGAVREDLAVAAPGLAAFATPVPEGADIALEVLRPPLGPRQTCGFAPTPPARMPPGDLTVALVCATTLLSVGGRIDGLAPDAVGLVLENVGPEGPDELSVIGGSVGFSFGRRLPSGAAYAARVKAQPQAQTCTLTGGQGVVGDVDVTGLVLACE